MSIMVILSIVLNSYWMLLMIKMIIRVIKRSLAPAKPQENIEKIELVKADSLAQRENENDCAGSTQGSNAAEQIEEEQNDTEEQDQKLECLGMEI